MLRQPCPWGADTAALLPWAMGSHRVPDGLLGPKVGHGGKQDQETLVFVSSPGSAETSEGLLGARGHEGTPGVSSPGGERARRTQLWSGKARRWGSRKKGRFTERNVCT